MVEIRVEQRFRAAPAVVFDSVADHARFIVGRGLVCRLSREGHPVPCGLGAVREVRSGPVVLVEAITAWQPGQGYDYRIQRVRLGPLPLPFVHELGELRVLADGEGALVIWRSRFRVPLIGVGPALESRLAAAGSRTFSALLRRAAARLEGGLSGAAPPASATR